jgi:hypothetical protein
MMTLFVVIALVPSTFVIFAINVGMFYLAWSIGAVPGAIYTIAMVFFFATLYIGVKHRVRKLRSANAAAEADES